MNAVVVTGATSMIGVAIIRSCLKNGVSKIYAVVRPDCKKLHRLPKNNKIEIICCDIENYGNLPDLLPEKCDVFYHVAWSLTGSSRNADLSEQCKNILYTLDAVNAATALGCSKFIGAGSQAEYGRLDIERISPESPVNPVQPYGIAKYAAGKMALEQADRLGISCLWVRIFSVYGIYDKPSSMISSSLSKLIEGQVAQYTPAEQRWDYLFSEDAGEAFYLIGEKACGNKVYCLGSGIARPLKDYIEQMRVAVANDAKVDIGSLPYPAGVLMNLCADIQSLEEDTGFYPETDFSEGIKKTIAWMRAKEN